MSSNKKKNLNKMDVDKTEEANRKKEDAYLEADDDEDFSEDNDSDEADSDDFEADEEVQVEFEGRAPVDPDAQGISQLLQRLFLRAHINCNQMADLLIAQNFVGSVICQCEEDGVASEAEDDNMVEDGTIFGITSVLNLSVKKDKPSVEQLRTYLLERAGKHAPQQVQQQLREVLENEQRHVGFLINERFINIPAQISVPLLQNLQQEIEAAKAKKMKFNFDTLLLLVKFHRKEAEKGKPAEDQYTNAEEELLSDRAKFNFEYSVATESDSGMSGDWLKDSDEVMTPYRKLLALEAKQLPKLIKDIQGFINGE